MLAVWPHGHGALLAIVVRGLVVRKVVDSAGIKGHSWYHGVRAPSGAFSTKLLAEQRGDDFSHQSRNISVLPHAWGYETLLGNG